MPGSWRQLPHTADVRLEAHGDTVAEVVEALLRGLYAVAFGHQPPPQPLRWEAWAPEAEVEPRLLLVELLGEALFRLQVRNEAVTGFRGDLRAGHLGTAPPDPRTPQVREIKAVTYNEPVLREETDGWLARVTLDL